MNNYNINQSAFNQHASASAPSQINILFLTKETFFSNLPTVDWAMI